MKRFVRWFQRWIGFEKVKEVAIQRSVVDDLCDMAKSAHPKEMLAFLAATDGVVKGTLVINEIQLQAYWAGDSSAMFNLWQLPGFTNIVGTVHSHPSYSNRPSGADMHLWGQYGVVHAIIKKPYRAQDVAFYDKLGNAIDVTFRT